LLLVDRPTGSEQQEQAPATTQDDADDDDGDDDEAGSDTGTVPACVDHTAVGLDLVYGTTLGAGDDVGGCGTGADAVVSWTAPSTGTYRFTVASDFDSMIGVYRGSCADTLLGCNDDCYGLDGAVEYFASEGESVFIVVDSYAGEAGDFTLSIARGSASCDSGGWSSTSGGTGSTTW
jgi:hypothetical protein